MKLITFYKLFFNNYAVDIWTYIDFKLNKTFKLICYRVLNIKFHNLIVTFG